MADITYTIAAIDQSTSVVAGIEKTFDNLQMTMGRINRAYQEAKKVIDATVGAQVTYANQVRTITQITGQSAEAVSRMIQVADDYKISTDQLTLAMKKLAGEGLTLTTDSLAQMSDEYLKLSAGVERQTYLTEKFGRSGIAFSEIMLAGGDAIRSQAAAINQNLILTDKAVKQARQYEISLDNLNDSITGVKIGIGQKLIPVLTELLDAQVSVTQAAEEDKASWMRYIPVLGGVWQGYISIKSAIQDVKQNIEDNKPVDSATQSWIGMGEALARAAELQNLLGEETESAVVKITDYSNALAVAVGGLGNFAVAAYQATLAEDGNFTAADAQAVNDYALAIGAVTEEEYKAAAAAIALQVALDNLPDNVDVAVRVAVYNAAVAGSTYDPYGAVSGGAVYPTPPSTYIPASSKAGGGPFSGWAMVGDSAGGGRTPYTEYVYAPHGAVVYNQKQMSGQSAPPMAGGGIIPPMQSPNIVTLSPQSVRDLADALSFKLQPYL